MAERRGLKRADLRPCRRCGKGVLHAGTPIFYRLTVEIFGAGRRAIERAAGLELMTGGTVAIAAALGPDEDLANPVGEPLGGLLCLPCMMDMHAAELLNDATEPAADG